MDLVDRLAGGIFVAVTLGVRQRRPWLGGYGVELFRRVYEGMKYGVGTEVVLS